MKTTDEKIFLVIATMLSFLLALACAEVSVGPEVNIDGTNSNKVKASEPFFHTLDITTQNTLKIEGVNGTINLESVSGTNLVTISGEKIVSAYTYQDASSQLEYLKVEISELENELVVKTTQPQNSNGRTYTVNYTIKVPENLNLTVEAVNGIINGRINIPLQGTTDMFLTNGIVELDIPQTTSAEFVASTVNGSISTRNLVLHNRIETLRSLKGTLGDGEGTASFRTTNAIIDISGF